MAEVFLSHDLVLTKTVDGFDELERRSRGLHVRARRILILCDGNRRLGEIVSVLGASAVAVAFELMEQGFLAVSASAELHSPALSSAGAKEKEPEPAGPSGMFRKSRDKGNKASSRNRRRSIAMARMYMFDMVHRLLGDQEEPARAYLRDARSPEALVDAFYECLLLIEEISGAEMAGKVASQLLEMAPEEMMETLSRRTALLGQG